ncbi:MAG: hypothetical protein FJY85_03215 [Deltaproteobacteria bacterium]|nr:hypothetical protein [Deltaproteobacteria bacterium]
MTMKSDNFDLRKKVLDKLIDMIEEMAVRAEASRCDAQARANEHAGKLESRFDTFREEAQYLAYGQGLRREELLRSLDLCHRLRAGIRDDGEDSEWVRPG